MEPLTKKHGYDPTETERKALEGPQIPCQSIGSPDRGGGEKKYFLTQSEPSSL